ncbi:hypothetical protein FPV67DRAFT_1478853 [Lyophyllum atratum]|nr:hypothetical protein FPV67DRAFT_1478853 [Lyophyllum atratum]
MLTAASSTVLDNNSDFQAVETTPLVGKSSSTSRSARSYTNNPNFYSKRRIHIKSRSSKPIDKLRINTVNRVDENGDEESAPSFTTLLAPSSTYLNDCTTCKSSCVPRDSSPSPLASTPRRHKSLMSSVSLTLENTGSVARDHLASERTFLAYVRTSLAIASSGVALVQLFTVASANLRHSPEHRLHTYIRPLGAATIVMGLIVLMIGVVRYFSIQAALTKGNFPVARAVTGFITATLTLLVVVTFGILVAGKLEPPKRRH